MKAVGLLFAFALSSCSLVSPCERFPSSYEVSDPLTIPEIEARSLEDHKSYERKDVPSVPFGFINNKWEAFKARIGPGETLVHFKSDAASWQQLHGREGYARVKGECVQATIVSKVS